VIHSSTTKKEINHRSTTKNDNVELTSTLTVKGSIITIADDLLKNDGRRFLDMMEKLTERKMQKERQVASLSDHDDDEEEEEDEDEEEEDNSEEDDDDEEEVFNCIKKSILHVIKSCIKKKDSRTEEQRMEEGRKMFQVFAARMFEQRVLTAYREKVAQDRQKRLIEELEEEEKQRQERELRKQQEKEKKRDKKR
jgi:hypothetical protein